MQETSCSIRVEHATRSSAKAFDAVIADLEKQLGHVDMDAMLKAVKGGDGQNVIASMEGTSGLMTFANIDLAGIIPSMTERKTKARQYLIGNPLIATQMICHNLEVGLYVPLRIFVTEIPSGTMFVFDRPVTLLGQWGDPRIDAVAKDLEKKLESLIAHALS